MDKQELEEEIERQEKWMQEAKSDFWFWHHKAKLDKLKKLKSEMEGDEKC